MSQTRSPLTPDVLLALMLATLLFAAGAIGFFAPEVAAPLSPDLVTFLESKWAWLLGGGLILDLYGMTKLTTRLRAKSRQAAA